MSDRKQPTPPPDDQTRPDPPPAPPYYNMDYPASLTTVARLLMEILEEIRAVRKSVDNLWEQQERRTK